MEEKSRIGAGWELVGLCFILGGTYFVLSAFNSGIGVLPIAFFVFFLAGVCYAFARILRELNKIQEQTKENGRLLKLLAQENDHKKTREVSTKTGTSTEVPKIATGHPF